MSVTNIRIKLRADGGGIQKTIAPKHPHQKKGGTYLWRIKNELGKPVEINLVDFDPPEFIEILSSLPTTALPGKNVLVEAEVIEAGPQKVVYKVMVDRSVVDPDLIIDGDRDVPPIGGRQKKNAKKKTKKNTKRKSRKKKR
jgi:hypothetical protein